MSNCKNCGAELHPNAKFCHLCGNRIETQTEEPIPVAVPPVKKQEPAVQNAELYKYVDTSAFVNADKVMAVPPLWDDEKFVDKALSYLAHKDTPAGLFDYFKADEVQHDYVNVYVMKGLVESHYWGRVGNYETDYETEREIKWFTIEGNYKYSGTVHATLGSDESACLNAVFDDNVIAMAERYQKELDYPVGTPEDPAAEYVRELESMLKEDADKAAEENVLNEYHAKHFRVSSAIQSREITVYSIPINFFRFSYSLSPYKKKKAFWVAAFDVEDALFAGNIPSRDSYEDIQKLVDKKMHFKLTRPLVINILLAIAIFAIAFADYFSKDNLEWLLFISEFLAIGLGLGYFLIYRKIRENKVRDLWWDSIEYKTKKISKIKRRFFGRDN